MDADLVSFESMIAAQETAKWTYWIMWATCFSGVATFSAVVLSLWLTRRENKVKLKCDVGQKDLIINSNVDSVVKKGIAIKITNVSRFSVVISNVGWDCGKGLYLHQLFGDHESHTLPKRIEYGEICLLWIELKDDDNWYKKMAGALTKDGRKYKTKGLKLLVSTTTSKPILVKPEKSLILTIDQEIEKMNNRF
ncbi:hypothetical protein [Yersinia frederiksenii]|uniref:hypothetical protein n=1 Tax=Yersinia frederiksenii TaxID=29484 RepID=UPI0005E629A3|nr:hypothetical protein [Yersinia frederiksenii]CFR18206.1 Uncharacterised protein [Yersinia frederiksenii]